MCVLVFIVFLVLAGGFALGVLLLLLSVLLGTHVDVAAALQ